MHISFHAFLAAYFFKKCRVTKVRVYTSGEVLKDRKFWADAEVVALRAGVKRHGVGKWVRILKDIDFGPHLQGTI